MENTYQCSRCAYSDTNGDCRKDKCDYMPRFKVDLISLIRTNGTKYTNGQLWSMDMAKLDRIYKKGIRKWN